MSFWHPFSAIVALATLSGAQPAPQPVALDRLLEESPAPNLSDYRLFNDPAARQPNARVLPYALQTPLFSDHALKFRYAYVPAGKAVGYRAVGPLDFPVGTTLVKHFGYPADIRAPDRDVRILETRLLIRHEAGWVALPYVWNAEGTDAVLKRTGAKIDVSWTHADGKPRSVRYAVPNTNQCKGCHDQAGALVPIGPTARNLRPVDWQTWRNSGVLGDAPAKVARLPIWNDPATGNVPARARAYLDVNCAHCHSPKGPASNSGLFLEWEQADRVAQGIGKRPVAAGRGSGDREVAIAPGSPDDSILVHRMESIDPGVMMPELGRTIVHDEAVTLIRAYVAGMTD